MPTGASTVGSERRAAKTHYRWESMRSGRRARRYRERRWDPGSRSDALQDAASARAVSLSNDAAALPAAGSGGKSSGYQRSQFNHESRQREAALRENPPR